jgi:hypothetical protein
MIQIIAHRGLWTQPHEKNTKLAFKNALIEDFGIETDFRDMVGELVVSHDIPEKGAMLAQQLAELYLENPVDAPMALNVKSDGLYGLISEFITAANLKNYFVFDMSIPDTLGYIRKEIPFYTRVSEFESVPAFLEHAKGVWLDAFQSDWYDADILRRYLDAGKGVAIVSPELHRRPHRDLWGLLKKNQLHLNPMLSICTDFPIEAREFFNAED